MSSSLALALVALLALPQEIPAGRVAPDVRTRADPGQSYALYLPTAYTPDRGWPLILVFDPGGRGAAAAARFQSAAERYGYIVAGSNNSRNGVPGLERIVSALTLDVAQRFAINERRVYTAGMSGGARVAFAVALSAEGIAGVIAASAGYPDSTPRKSVSFPVFGTAGTEDFNYLEMRELDRALTSPHRLVVFEGGHVWASNELLLEAVEWMEIQAVKSGRAPADPARVAAIFDTRVKAAEALPPGSLEAARAFRALATDFSGLLDVSPYVTRAEALEREGTVRSAERRDREAIERERELLSEAAINIRQLEDQDARVPALAALRSFVKDWSSKATKPQDSPERRMARRILSTLAATPTTDAAFRQIIATCRLNRR